MSAACNPLRPLVCLLLTLQLAGCALSGEQPQTRGANDIVPPTAAPQPAAVPKVTASSAAPAAVPAAVPVTSKTSKATAANAAMVSSTAPVPASGVIPPAAQKQFDAALSQLKAGQVAPAQQQLLRLTADYPDFAAPWINLGLIEAKAGKHEAALNYFKQAAEHAPNSATAQTYLGLGYRQVGKFKEAQAAYQAALVADDSFALAHFNLGVLYDLYLQRPDQALQHYERYQAIQATPDAKVASWIKDLKNRLGTKAKPETQP